MNSLITVNTSLNSETVKISLTGALHYTEESVSHLILKKKKSSKTTGMQLSASSSHGKCLS